MLHRAQVEILIKSISFGRFTRESENRLYKALDSMNIDTSVVILAGVKFCIFN